MSVHMYTRSKQSSQVILARETIEVEKGRDLFPLLTTSQLVS